MMPFLIALMLSAPPVDATVSAVRKVLATYQRADDRRVTLTKHIAEKLGGRSVGITAKHELW